MKYLIYILHVLILFPFLGIVSACSNDNETEEEYANWQERNEAIVNTWATNSALTKIKCYTKDQTTTGTNLDYVYIEEIEAGSSDEKPLFTDTVRVAYRGRLIPSKTYDKGYIFDESFKGDFSWETADIEEFTMSGLVDGFTTALLQMKKGDYWRVYIPYPLGYNTSSSADRPAYSNLIFEIAMFDYWSPGEKRPVFKSR